MVSNNKASKIIILLACPTIALAGYMFILFVRQQQIRQKSGICSDRLRQIGRAMAMYVADNDGYLPGETQWYHGTIPLLPRSGCPVAEPVPDLIPPLPDPDHILPGYAFNTGLAGKTGLENNRLRSAPRLYSTLEYPQSTVAVFDYTSGIARTSELDFYKSSGNDWPKQLVRGWERHGGGGNYLFFDGHVKWFKESQLLATEADICEGNKNLPHFCL